MDYNEFIILLAAVDTEMTESQSKKVFVQLDENKDGYISFGEFLRVLDRKC